MRRRCPERYIGSDPQNRGEDRREPLGLGAAPEPPSRQRLRVRPLGRAPG